jgi:hypothetical protein
MAGKYTLEQFEADKKAREERQEREAREREARERRERVEKDNARRAYIAQGSTEEEFERGWPEMREEARRRRSRWRWCSYFALVACSPACAQCSPKFDRAGLVSLGLFVRGDARCDTNRPPECERTGCFTPCR